MKKYFLARFLLNGERTKTGRPDQERFTVAVTAESQAEAEIKIRQLRLPGDFTVEEIDLAANVEDIPALLKRYCVERGFDLAVAKTSPASGRFPNCV